MKQGTRKRRWTAAEDERLKRLVAEGKTAAEIGRCLHRREKSVSCRKGRLGLHRSASTYEFSYQNPTLLAELIKFKMAGWKHKEIADVFGKDVGQISRILIKNGFRGFMSQRKDWKETYRCWTEIEVSRLKVYLRQGMGYAEIQAKLSHRSISSIRNKSKRLLPIRKPVSLPPRRKPGNPPRPLPAEPAFVRRTPAELHQAILASLLEYPGMRLGWHAKRLNTLASTIRLVSADMRIKNEIGFIYA